MKKLGELLKAGGKDFGDNQHIVLPNGDIYERTTKDITGWNWVKIN